MNKILLLILLIIQFACSLSSTGKSNVTWMVDSVMINQKKVILQTNFAAIQNNKTYLLPIPISNSQQSIYETGITNSSGNYQFFYDPKGSKTYVQLHGDYIAYNGVYEALLYKKNDGTFLSLKSEQVIFYFSQWLR